MTSSSSPHARVFLLGLALVTPACELDLLAGPPEEEDSVWPDFHFSLGLGSDEKPHRGEQGRIETVDTWQPSSSPLTRTWAPGASLELSLRVTEGTAELLSSIESSDPRILRVERLSRREADDGPALHVRLVALEAGNASVVARGWFCFGCTEGHVVDTIPIVVAVPVALSIHPILDVPLDWYCGFHATLTDARGEGIGHTAQPILWAINGLASNGIGSSSFALPGDLRHAPSIQLSATWGSLTDTFTVNPPSSETQGYTCPPSGLTM